MRPIKVFFALIFGAAFLITLFKVMFFALAILAVFGTLFMAMRGLRYAMTRSSGAAFAPPFQGWHTPASLSPGYHGPAEPLHGYSRQARRSDYAGRHIEVL